MQVSPEKKPLKKICAPQANAWAAQILLKTN
jgi:hypothetical protein